MAAKEMAIVQPQALAISQGATHSFEQLERIAEYVAQSRMLPGVENKAQAMTLMLLSQAEGRHPLEAQQRYHIIKGRPSKKAEAMLSDFQEAGGKVTWHMRTAQKCSATFSHPATDPVTIDWDIEMAQKAQLMGNDGWKKYPRAMLHARTVSEGVRSTYPKACHGMYTPEEVADMVQEDRLASIPQEEPRQAKVMQIEQVKPAAPQSTEDKTPPVPDVIVTMPEWIKIKPLAALEGIPFEKMDDDDLALVADAVGKFHLRYKASGKLSTRSAEWLNAIVATVCGIADLRKGDVPPPSDTDAPGAQ